MNWTTETPASPGFFLWKRFTADKYNVEFVEISTGEWRRTQNPEWLYVYSITRGLTALLQDYEDKGDWYGPISEPPPAMCVK